MQPHAVEPGIRIAGRYRLHERHGGWIGAPSWWGTDELLDRKIWLWVLALPDPVSRDAMSAARDAARLSDPRFVRILDAGQTDGLVYLVGEAVSAPTLTDLLSAGPLPPATARRLVADVAGALSGAHAVGLTHGLLDPDNVICTDRSVKILGVGIAGALAVPRIPDAEARAADVRSCGELLYAALTARWPGARPSGLPPAPAEGGQCRAPRQVRAGVPADLDMLTCRILRLPSRRGEEPLTSTGEVARALADPPFRRPPLTAEVPADDGPVRLAAPPSPGRMAVLVRRGALAVLGLGLGLGAWQLGIALLDPGPPPPVAPTPVGSPQPSATAPRSLPVSSVRDFDPDGDGEENGAQAIRALDGDPATSWRTKTYFRRADLGGIKDGVGLVLDLGAPEPVGAVRLDLLGVGSDVELRAADRFTDDLDGYRLIRRASGVGDAVTLSPRGPLTTRFLLVWFTRLPPAPDSPGDFRGGLTEVNVWR